MLVLGPNGRSAIKPPPFHRDYQRLFEIAQRLLQSGGNESVELICGIGLARWSRPEESIDLPILR